MVRERTAMTRCERGEAMKRDIYIYTSGAARPTCTGLKSGELCAQHVGRDQVARAGWLGFLLLRGRHGRQTRAHPKCRFVPCRPQGQLLFPLSLAGPFQPLLQAQASSLAQRVQFLEAKGLTGSEIEEALRQANSSRPLPSHIQQPPYGPVHGPLPYVPQLNPPWDWRDYFVRATNTTFTLGELMG